MPQIDRLSTEQINFKNIKHYGTIQHEKPVSCHCAGCSPRHQTRQCQRDYPYRLIGKTIVIVSNLQPAKIRGIESCGMLLAAKAGKELK
ncbi:MAG: hypothetical protein IJ993_08220, partial [Akkermansia sp.]|nr:hypothetical protein [Akkermansia sp.]